MFLDWRILFWAGLADTLQRATKRADRKLDALAARRLNA